VKRVFSRLCFGRPFIDFCCRTGSAATRFQRLGFRELGSVPHSAVSFGAQVRSGPRADSCSQKSSARSGFPFELPAHVVRTWFAAPVSILPFPTHWPRRAPASRSTILVHAEGFSGADLVMRSSVSPRARVLALKLHPLHVLLGRQLCSYLPRLFFDSTSLLNFVASQDRVCVWIVIGGSRSYF
jgi:hypothetical protein